MEHAHRAGEIEATGRMDRRDTERVARNGDSRRQPGNPQVPVELRQAGVELRTHPDPAGKDGDEQQPDDDEECA